MLRKRKYIGMALIGMLIVVATLLAILSVRAWLSDNVTDYPPLRVSQPVCGQWNSSRIGTVAEGGLRGIAVLSESDIWIVGASRSFFGFGKPQGLMNHWNGQSWSTIAIPNMQGRLGMRLSAISAVSQEDIWAVGNTEGHDNDQTIVLHWDGIAWSRVASPSLGEYIDELNGVSALSTDEVWAVGDYSLHSNDPSKILILRWDGHTWSRMSSPDLNQEEKLVAVDALSSDDIWAVGMYGNSGIEKPLLVHWDGNKWSVVESPISSGMSVVMSGVRVIAHDDAWAVGYYNDGSVTDRYKTLILHWNGLRWSVSKSPNGYSDGNNYLLDLTAFAADNVWTVGEQIDHSGSLAGPLVSHWDGKAWNLVPSPNLMTASTYNAVSSYGDKIWAVGSTLGDGPLYGTVSSFTMSNCSATSVTP